MSERYHRGRNRSWTWAGSGRIVDRVDLSRGGTGLRPAHTGESRAASHQDGVAPARPDDLSLAPVTQAWLAAWSELTGVVLPDP